MGERFFAFLDENTGATFHHATAHDGVQFLYCNGKDKGIWFLPKKGMGPMQPRGRAIFEADRRRALGRALHYRFRRRQAITGANRGNRVGGLNLCVLCFLLLDLFFLDAGHRWKEIRVDRLFAAKIVTRDESQGRPAHYLPS